MKMLVLLKPHFPCDLPYTALRLRDDITHGIKGGAKCHLTHEMTSQTAEYYGVIGFLTMIIILPTKYSQPEGNTEIEVWIDNDEGGRLDYTLWCIMSKVHKLISPRIQIHFQKVKSHQDKIKPSIEVCANVRNAGRRETKKKCKKISPYISTVTSTLSGKK